MAVPSGHRGEEPLQESPGAVTAPTGEPLSAEAAAAPPEMAAMNECITYGEVAEALKQPVKPEEAVELTRKVRALMPPVREELVEEIRAQIKSGAYVDSSEDIAVKLMERALGDKA